MWRLTGCSCQASPRLRLHQEFAGAQDDLRAAKLDVRHEALMREAAHAVFQVEAVRAEQGEQDGNSGLMRSA